MKKPNKRLYLVYREVMATSVERATKGKGIVYSVQLADDKSQPDPPKKTSLGFTTKKVV